MNNDKSIEKIINEQFLNKKDFLYIKNIRTHGIKYLNNCFINNYEKDKNLINTYSLIYLSNNVFKPYSDFCKSIACFCLSSCK